MTEIKGLLYVHVLLDKSGSMLANKGTTIAAYNNYIESLPDDAVVSLSLFSTGQMEHLRVMCRKQAAKFTADEYECRGNTALRDAIGETVQMIDSAAREYARVAMVIQTDGQENASREFTQAQIKQMLTDKQDGEGWLVIFLGAGLEAFEQAPLLGLRAGNSMQYDSANVRHTMASVSRATASYGAAANVVAGQNEASFTDDERNKSK